MTNATDERSHRGHRFVGCGLVIQVIALGGTIDAVPQRGNGVCGRGFGWAGGIGGAGGGGQGGLGTDQRMTWVR